MAGKQINLKVSIAKAISFLKKHFDIKEVILFGSQLSKKTDEWSDIDLIVISPDFKGKSYEEIVQTFAELALKFTPNIEVHPYTPDDLKDARPTNFLGHILQIGKIVYRNGKLLI